ncbi:outer membrane beta-barrel protein [Cryomorphaceae bacterium]|nr:outer membrane beta-barrel protein [Cryomorphaceae bacterium]
MKKWMMTLAVVLMIAGTAQAQVFQIGARAGINRADVTADEILDMGDDLEQKLTSGTQDYGYHLGLYTRFKLLGLYIQPEALFTKLNTEVTIDEYENGVPTGNTEDARISYTRLDFPILAGLKLGPVRVNAGPVASRVITNETEGISITLQDGTYWGYQAGIGFDIWKILIDLKYEDAFNSQTNQVTFAGQQFDVDSRASQLILSLGYRF